MGAQRRHEESKAILKEKEKENVRAQLCVGRQSSDGYCTRLERFFEMLYQGFVGV